MTSPASLPPASTLGPFRHPSFRILWATAVLANVCVWMSDVSAAWTMTTLSTDPRWVALVQTASLLPMLLLALPAGALADGVDHRSFLLVTQTWAALAAGLLSLAAFGGWLAPGLLLGLVFANGIGLAMRMPLLAAAAPEAVPRADLPAAMALNAVAMNASRIIGPVCAGALIAMAGSPWVFAVNAALSVAAFGVILRWRPAPREDRVREPLFPAMRAGVLYVVRSRHMQGVLARMSLYFGCTAALMALLPLLARRLGGGEAWVYTLLIAAMGSGAIAASWLLPRLRASYPRDPLVLRAALAQAVAMGGLAALASSAAAMEPGTAGLSVALMWLAVPLMLVSGASWIAAANTLAVSAQLSLPRWISARIIAISQMCVMGASALGAALWGQVAAWWGLPASLLIAGGMGVAAIAAVNHWCPYAGLQAGMGDGLTPAGSPPHGQSRSSR